MRKAIFLLQQVTIEVIMVYLAILTLPFTIFGRFIKNERINPKFY
jgi:hypothetical protein